MKLKAIIPLALAIVLGLVTAVLVKNATGHHTAPASTNLIAVVTAKQDVDAGHALTADDLEVTKVPAEFAPLGVFSEPAQLDGRVTITALARSQTIIETLLAPTGSGAGLQALVPPGYRAFTMDVSETTSVGGMITPGCRVDVLATLNDPKTGLNASHTILQDMKVTACGRSLTPPQSVPGAPPAPSAPNVTLLCTPQQAQIMQLTVMTSRPWLVLRGNRDNNASPLPACTISDLSVGGHDDAPMTVAAPANPPEPAMNVIDTSVPAPTKRMMTIIRGGSQSDVSFVLAPTPQPTFSDIHDRDNDRTGDE